MNTQELSQLSAQTPAYQLGVMRLCTRVTWAIDIPSASSKSQGKESFLMQ